MKVTLKLCEPALKAELAGIMALASLEVMATVSLTAFTRFQFASTAFTVTLKALPAARALGVPVLPLAVPGAAVSPGTNNCNLANRPALTVSAAVVLAALLLSVTSLAVTVALPAVFNVMLNTCVPFASGAFTGKVALPSDDVIPNVSVTPVTTF